MRKTFVIAAFIVSFVLCNAVSAANYSLGYVDLMPKTYADGETRTAISFSLQDADDYYFPPVENGVKSFTICDQNGKCQTYPYVKSLLPEPDESISEKLKYKEKVRNTSYHMDEIRGIDYNKSGIIEIGEDRYERRVNAAWEYSIFTSRFPVTGGTYTVWLNTNDNQQPPPSKTLLDVPAGLTLLPVTDINVRFDSDGRLNVSWTVPDVYLISPEAYQDATIQIRVDRYSEDGNPNYSRVRVENLPLFLNGNIFNNYTLLKWESDLIRLYIPIIKVQVRISSKILNNQNQGPISWSEGVSDWKEFYIGGAKPH